MRELWCFEVHPPIEPYPEVLWHRVADASGTTVCGQTYNGDFANEIDVFEQPDAGEMICPGCASEEG